MESVPFPELVADYGPIGAWVVMGGALFRYLLTRQDRLARANLQELQRQLRETQKRMLRAELLLRAYARAGYTVPEDAVKVELILHGGLDELFPDFTPSYPAEE